MTFHTNYGFAEAEPVDYFQSPSLPAISANPLAGQFVKQVLPFILVDEDNSFVDRRDIEGVKVLKARLDAGKKIAADAMLLVDADDIAATHGDEVEDIARFSTGLYVLVKDMKSVELEVSGEVLSDVNTAYGMRERAVRTSCGLLIFACSVEEKSPCLPMVA